VNGWPPEKGAIDRCASAGQGKKEFALSPDTKNRKGGGHISDGVGGNSVGGLSDCGGPKEGGKGGLRKA